MFSQSSVFLLAALSVAVVTSYPAAVSESHVTIHNDYFVCNKEKTTEGSHLISDTKCSGRQECRKSCTGGCQVAVFDAKTQKCRLYSDNLNKLTLTPKDSATVMVKTGQTGDSCDASYNCYRGRSDSYQGRVNVTKSGVACQKWSSQTPHQHNRYNSAKDFVDFALPDNFCRSAVGENYAPWCYTSDPNTRWDYCDVKQCAKDCCVHDIEEEKMEVLQISLASLNSEVEDKEKDISALQSEKSEMKSQLTTLDNDVTSQLKKIEELEKSQTSQNSQVSSLENTINSMNQAIQALEAAKSSNEAELKSLQNAKTTSDQQIASLKSQISSLNSQVQAPTQLKRTNCKWTGYVNNWDDRLQWTAPGRAVIVGSESYHDNGKEDRRWKFYYCELTA